jgi:hypothetical protein
LVVQTFWRVYCVHQIPNLLFCSRRKCENMISLFSSWLLFHAMSCHCYMFSVSKWWLIFHKQGHKKRNDSSGNCLISIWTVFDLHDTRVILAFVRIGNDRKISSWEIFCIRTSINSFQIAVSSIQPLKYVTYCDNQVVDLLLAFEHQCFEHNDESQSLFLANVNKS